MKKYWNNKNVIEESKKYSSKSEFQQEKSGAYHYALEHNLLRDMNWLKRPQIVRKWNNKNVIEESKKFSSRGEFAKLCDGGYKYALKHNLLEQMYWLKPKSLFGENAQKIDCVYSYEFVPFNTVYVGRTIDINRRDKQHKNGVKSAVYNFAKKEGINIPKMKILEENITILEGQKLEAKWVEEYLKNGWKLLNKGKCGEGCGSVGTLNTVNRKWNNINVIEESKKYKSKIQFKTNSNGAYNYARKHNLLCKMSWLTKPDVWNKKWKDNESVIYESKKYTSKSMFKKNSRGAYNYAIKHNLLREMIWLTKKNLE